MITCVSEVDASLCNIPKISSLMALIDVSVRTGLLVLRLLLIDPTLVVVEKEF